MLPVLYRETNWPSRRSFGNEWFDREFGRLARNLFGNGQSNESEAAAYPMNVWEDDDAIHIEAEMPGFKRDEIDITIEQGTLQISAERKREKSEPADNGSPLLTERTWSRYFRSVALPMAVQEDHVSAKCEDGVLRLTLPKRPEVKPRRIKVQ